MIKKRLLNIVPESKIAVFKCVIFKFIQLLMNILFIYVLADSLPSLYLSKSFDFKLLAVVFVFVVLVRDLCITKTTQYAFEASKSIKLEIRKLIYNKLLRLGNNYQDHVASSKVVQMSVEGAEQLETYFGQYLPQFFYSMIAPFILFLFVSQIDVISALFLLLCVPLIPIVIIIVQKIAKRILSKYWGQYTELGDSFLENLQGLTTLKIYEADNFKTKEMEKQSELFRKVTMKVLMMQLNSTSIMDLVTYGGSALGILIAINRFSQGFVDLKGMIMIILLSSEFFIPMRQLGSYFHVAMNGMAASDNIFELLDLEEEVKGTADIENCSITVDHLSFAYNEEREILHNLSFTIPQNQFIAFVGESGSGKSTIASLLTGKHLNYQGEILFGNQELKSISEDSLLKNITYISHHSLLFQGTVKENLLLGKEDASDEELNQVLKQTNLYDFFMNGEGLDFYIKENGSNLSGGQRQRLAIARTLLHNTNIYIFDEATSNIDVESENEILSIIHKLTQTKTIIMISHRLLNTVKADQIYVLKDGEIIEKGNHSALLENNKTYASLWNTQQTLENYEREDD